MRIIDKIITRCDCKYGAPIGRANVGDHPFKFLERVYDCAVPLTDGGYDRGNVYWGYPNNLRVSYTKDLSYIYFYRTN